MSMDEFICEINLRYITKV